jgi:hypothetical protein
MVNGAVLSSHVSPPVASREVTVKRSDPVFDRTSPVETVSPNTAAGNERDVGDTDSSGLTGAIRTGIVWEVIY